MTSIKTKLAIGLTLFLIIAFGILAGLNYWETKTILIGQIEKELSLSAESYSKDISGWLSIVTTEMAASARSPVFLTENKALIKAFVDQEMSRNKLFENFLLFKPNGDYQAYALKQETGNLAQREYFKQAINGNIYISNPITSVGTGKPVSMVGIPVKSGGQTIGAIAIPINVDDIQNTVLNIKLAKTGYGFAVANDGTIIVHPDKELVGKSNLFTDFPFLKDAHDKALTGEKNIYTYIYNGEERYITFEPIKGTTWLLAITVPVSEVTSILNSYAATSGITVVVVLVIMLVLAVICIFLFTNQIVKPLQVLGEVAERISKGDLSVNRVNITSNDELGRLARIFETMMDNLRKLIRSIGDSSELLNSSSEELMATARQSTEISTHVASSIANTAKESEVQVKIVGNALDLVRKIETGARERARELSNTVDISQKAVSAATDGNQAVDTAVNQMNSIRHTVDNSAQVVTELGERSKEIGQIIETISNIAGQTNLLALNAAIEAARAGEQGRGFAVVADEVRKLAEQSQEAAKQISMLIGHIQAKTTEAVKAMDSGTQEVRRGTEVVDRAGQAFKYIDTYVKEVANITQKAAVGLNQLVDDNNAVLEAMQRAGEISSTISTLAQTISTATEEQSVSMGDIATASQHLTQLADQLQTEIAQFKV